MIFANLDKLPPDPILGVTAAFRADPSPDKIDLGVGVYRDDAGNTPVPAAVRDAERALLDVQTTKTYVGPMGNAEFNQRIVELALGPLAAGLEDRTATIQTVGGCGALRVGAELIRASWPDAIVNVSDPTWANHEPLLGSAGVALARYPYYDAASRGVAFERMLEHFGRLPSGSILLLHACCHNPTGADLDAGQWSALAEVIENRGLVPFLDLAYQGFGDDLESDVLGLRLLASSCSAVAARAFLLEELRALPRAHRGARSHRRERCHGRRDRDPPGAHGEAHVLDAAGPRRGRRGAPAWRSRLARGLGVGARRDGVPHEGTARTPRGAFRGAATGP